jgi:hypothetical protein
VIQRLLGISMVVAGITGCTELQEGVGNGASSSTTMETGDTTMITTSASTATTTTTTTSPGTTVGTTEADTSTTSSSESGETTQQVVSEGTTETTHDPDTSSTEGSATSSTTDAPECDYFRDGGCGNCVDETCCTELMECETDPAMQCEPLLDCFDGEESATECLSMHGHPSTNGVRACVETECMPPCA